MSVERYLTGNRVYRHGSSAPTMGTVDPSGYVERELRKRMLMGEPSQTRSGLAQAALTRMRALQGGSQGASTSSPWMAGGGGSSGAVKPPTPTGTFSPGGGGNAYGLDQTALKAKLAATHAQHMAEVQQQKAANQAKLASRPKVSPTGKITSSKAKPRPVARPTALPWDMEAMQGKINAGDVLGQLRNQIMAGRQGAQRDYSQGLFDINQQQPGAERELLNSFAGRGLARSSGYGMGVGGIQNQFANARSGLSQQLTDLLNDYQNQETQGSATYNKSLAAIQQALAQRLSKRAGTLGFSSKVR